jgi:hypothetical protein
MVTGNGGSMADMADEESTNSSTGMANEIMNIMPSVSRIQSSVYFIY